MYSSRLIINSALLPECTKTPLNEFRDDYYRGTTLVIALPICMGQLLAIALSRLLTGAPGGIVPALRNQLSAGLSSGFSQPLRIYS
ncbi:hypothetical protein [Paenibacillus sp. FSL M7-1046]|uniref:SLC26A/SulP transporter domain-containing protein n=1 Tax=Paenibacillus borealis TaxID=160799 RepID=A0ABX3GXY8_PAEBO|nr:hypothetical protein BSK56_31015 [Paenibacillus borealis]